MTVGLDTPTSRQIADPTVPLQSRGRSWPFRPRVAVWERSVRSKAGTEAEADEESASLCVGRWREGEADAKENQYESQLPLSHVILFWFEF